MALNEFNQAGTFVDISEEGVRIWQNPNNYHDAALIKHDDFNSIALSVERWQKENKDKL